MRIEFIRVRSAVATQVVAISLSFALLLLLIPNSIALSPSVSKMRIKS